MISIQLLCVKDFVMIYVLCIMHILPRDWPSVAQTDLKLRMLVPSLEQLGLQSRCLNTQRLCLIFLSELRTHSAAHTGLELMILLIQPPMQLQLQGGEATASSLY